MTKKPFYLCIAVAAFFIGMLFGPVKIGAATPGILSYQGRVLVSSVPFTGTGQFKFALVNSAGTTTFWSNDGTSTNGSEPTAVVSLAVANGLYSVLLGDTTISGMTQAIPATAFDNADVRLRIWFNDGTNSSKLLSPDQRIAPVGYAQVAKGVDDGSITTAKIADGAVTLAKVAPFAKVRLRATAVQTLTMNGALVPVEYSVVDYDTHSHFSLTLPDRVVCKVAGKYHISGTVAITANDNGTRAAHIKVNGMSLAITQCAPSSFPDLSILNVSTVVDLQVNDFVQLSVANRNNVDLQTFPDTFNSLTLSLLP